MIPGRKKRIKVYLADDHPMFVSGISRMIEGDPDFRLAGTADNGLAAVEGILRHKPDVAVLDLGMPGLTGLQVITELRVAASTTKVILLTGTEVKESVFDAVEVGAEGYLLKTIDWTDLLDSIKRVFQGETPIIAHELVPTLASAIGKAREVEALSDQETAVLKGLLAGETFEGMAREMNVSRSTIKTYANRIYRKLGVKNRTGAVAEALRRGLGR